MKGNIGAFILVAFSLVGMMAESPAAERFHSLAFFPGNRQIIVTVEDKGGVTKLARVNLVDEKVDSFDKREFSSRYWNSASVSRDGAKVVFSLSDSGKNVQLAIMDSNGANITPITSAPGYRTFPSFSPDGKKVLYIKGGSGGVSDFDLHELILDVGKEVRLSNFEFYRLIYPSYQQNDDRFIFSAEGPLNINMLLQNPNFAAGYRKKFRENTIFEMDRSELKAEKLVPTFEYGDFTSLRGVSANGAILFLGRINPPVGSEVKQWGYDLFIRRGSAIGRVTTGSNVSSAAISLDGTQVAFLAPRLKTKGYSPETIWTVNADGSGLRELTLDMKP